MNIKSIKKPKRRIDVSYVSRFNLQSYGEDNLYPQNVRRVTSASGTAELCLSRYAKFIEGYGFISEALSEAKANRYGDTMDDILHLACQDLARYGGFALHVNYDVLCQVSGVSFVPFENCRLEEADDRGNVAHVLLHPDWEGKLTRSGKRVQVNDENIQRMPVFNPRYEVVMKQVMDAGGIDKYQGQVLWCSMAGKEVYPTPIYDAALTEISTDEGLGNVKYRNARNNFLPSCMVIAKRGIPRIGGDEREDEDGEAQMISDEDLRAFQGDENVGKILYVELENEEDEPKVVTFPTMNYDKQFTATDDSVIERIYAQFHQELFYSIRMGKLGFSGDVMRDAYEYYSGEVTNEQRFMARAFRRILDAWHDKGLAGADTMPQPLKYINSQTAENSETE